MPRALKDICLKTTKYIMYIKAGSMDFSNYGRLNPPKELFEIVAKAIRIALATAMVFAR